jgi:hypothetical protein
MSITDLAPAVAGERLFPTCAPWCAWHYAEDTVEEPGSCWAGDILIPGAVEVMATWDERRTANVYAWPDGTGEDAEPTVTEEPRPPLSITVFRADLPDHDEGVQFTSLEQAEASAHALLAMVARLRGDEQLAAVHMAAGLAVANTPRD